MAIQHRTPVWSTPQVVPHFRLKAEYVIYVRLGLSGGERPSVGAFPVKSVIRPVALALSILLVAGCAEVPSNKTIVSNAKHRFNLDLLRELEEMRADKPGEAQQFFMSQRLPNGATTLD